MIFHVPAALLQLGIGVGELPENRARTFSQNVGQHVEPAAMGHPQHDARHPMFPGVFDGQGNIQQRNQAFASLQEKLFAPTNFFRNKLLEHHRVSQPRENAQLLRASTGASRFCTRSICSCNQYRVA